MIFWSTKAGLLLLSEEVEDEELLLLFVDKVRVASVSRTTSLDSCCCCITRSILRPICRYIAIGG